MDKEFIWWKYITPKALSPLISMGAWVYLIKSNVLTNDTQLFGVGLGLLMFGGVLSAQSVLKVFAEKYNPKGVKDE